MGKRPTLVCFQDVRSGFCGGSESGFEMCLGLMQYGVSLGVALAFTYGVFSDLGVVHSWLGRGLSNQPWDVLRVSSAFGSAWLLKVALPIMGLFKFRGLFFNY